MADGFFEPGKATSKTTQVASPAKRQAYLAALGALAKRDIGGYPGKAGKPPLELDLNALIQLIESDPNALNRVVEQTGRPSSPSTFQNLATGATTLGLLAKMLLDEDKGGNSMGGSIMDFLRSIGAIKSDSGMGGLTDYGDDYSLGGDGDYGYFNESDYDYSDSSANLDDWIYD